MLGVCVRACVLDEGLCGVNVFVTVILRATEFEILCGHLSIIM